MMMSKQFSLSSLKTTKVPWCVDVKKFIFTEFISFFFFFLCNLMSCALADILGKSTLFLFGFIRLYVALTESKILFSIILSA